MRASKRVGVLVTLVAVGRASADDPPTGTGMEVGTSIAGAGGAGGREGAAGLRVAGHVAAGRLYDMDWTMGGAASIGNGSLGPVRASVWARQDGMHLGEPARPGDDLADRATYWLTMSERLDLEAQAPLARRRDLARARYTGAEVIMEGNMHGRPSPTAGYSWLPTRQDVQIVAGADGADSQTTVRYTQSVVRWWRDHDGDGVAHTRELLTWEVRAVDAMAWMVTAYAERDRPLVGGLRVDFRAGVASTSEPEVPPAVRAFPQVSAPVVDGALRGPIGGGSFEARYDRALFPTFDDHLALEDRATARAAWAPGRWSLAADAYIARTESWARAHAAGRTAITDGVMLRAGHQRRRWLVDASLEAGHSFYARTDDTVGDPVAGWRASLDVSWRIGAGR